VWIDDGVLHPLLHKTRAGNNLRKLRWVRLVLLFEDTCPACYKSCCNLVSAVQCSSPTAQYSTGRELAVSAAHAIDMFGSAGTSGAARYLICAARSQQL
jgi:hypothetical protein